MTPDQSSLIAAVAAQFGAASVVADPQIIAPWLGDWRGRYHGASPAMLVPRTTREVAAIVALAAEHRVPLVPQGGNTSMVGGATPPADGSALLISLRRMNQIRELSGTGRSATAEAGVILQALHDAAAGAGLRFPLTLGARGTATIGGLVATNAGGTQVLRHGTMRALVMGLEAVLPDGSIYDGLAALKKDNRGYDLDQLLVGAEGTLGIVTAARLKLVPAIRDRAVAWVGLESPAVALDLLRAIDGPAIESFEILPGESLVRVLRNIPDARAPLAGSHPWHVLIEAVAAGDDDRDPRVVLTDALALGLERGWIADATIGASEAQAEAFWALRDGLSAAERAAGPAVQHDIAVAVDAMPGFLVETARAVEARFPGTHASGFGHLGDGNVHFHVRAPDGVDAAAWYRDAAPGITRFVHDAVVAAGGTISAEHGIGQMKRAELERVGPPARLGAIRAIKHALDPLGIMNPGKLVALAEPGCDQ
ncbi:FAD-binding oxidoreductase [Sphingomonas japonica]|uniref:FAD/FMN-containing dehydrogenase n=1 Tax=Sphingomonas japonica TaxID=511662 RepID=A0ABX0TWR2_9SPHN|nr:FAD-binding oxidoreductase [Sphingomonas japonica]NIJ22678.1 FAD/FMN-containing dehydrogenase [Sphingomonas japonica]